MAHLRSEEMRVSPAQPPQTAKYPAEGLAEVEQLCLSAPSAPVRPVRVRSVPIRSGACRLTRHPRRGGLRLHRGGLSRSSHNLDALRSNSDGVRKGLGMS